MLCNEVDMSVNLLSELSSCFVDTMSGGVMNYIDYMYAVASVCIFYIFFSSSISCGHECTVLMALLFRSIPLFRIVINYAEYLQRRIFRDGG